MTYLKSCCFCCSLKTGSIVSGVSGILLAIATLVIMLTTNVEFKTIVIDWLPNWIVKIILAINLAMTVLISILLIIGVIKQNTFLMLPWVVLGIMLAIGLLISIIYTSVMFFIQEDTFNGVLWLILGLVAVVVYVYMWFVVFSYFQMVRDMRGRYMKAPYRR